MNARIIRIHENTTEEFQTLRIEATSDDQSMIQLHHSGKGQVEITIFDPTTEFLKSLIEVATKEISRRGE